MKRDREMAPALSMLPFAAYTRKNPPADKLVPVQEGEGLHGE